MPLVLNKRLQTGFEVSAPVLTFANTSVGAQQPEDKIIDYNGSATLTAIAKAVNPSTGALASGTIAYQWYKDGAAITGETSSNLYLNSQITSANYYCTATFTPSSGIAPAVNGPTISSRTAATTIRIFLTITSQPSYKRITEGQTALFDIAAVASNGDNASLRYEWFFNGSSVKTTVGGTYSSVSLSPGPGSYQVYCKVSQGGVPGATAAPVINSSIVSLDVDARPAAQCLGWDDPIRPGGKISNILTERGIKPGAESVWQGPWLWGTTRDTCYITFRIRIRDIRPRDGFSDTSRPFIAAFQCRIRGQGGTSGDIYNAFKVLEWNGNSSSENANNRQTLEFNTTDFNGETVRGYGDGGRILFERTETNAVALSTDLCCGRLKWDPGYGQPAMDILLLTTRRKSDGRDINMFPEVLTETRDNTLEYGRRYDPNIDIPENRPVTEITATSSPAASRPAAVIQVTRQKSSVAGFDRSEVRNYTLSEWTNTPAGTRTGDGDPPLGNSAISFGVGQWEIVAPDRDMEVAIEMAGAGGQNAPGWNGSTGAGGAGGAGVIRMRLLRGQTYTVQVGRKGAGVTSKASGRSSNYPNDNSPGGGLSGSDMDNNIGNGGGGTFLYKGGRLIAVAGGGGGAGRGAGVVGAANANPPNFGGNGGAPGTGDISYGTEGAGSSGGRGATNGPADNKNTALYDRNSRSNGVDNWQRDGECATWIPGTNAGACDCTYANATNVIYNDTASPKRTLNDDDPSTPLTQSCSSYGTSKITSSTVTLPTGTTSSSAGVLASPSGDPSVDTDIGLT